jgi:hypothetical protein
MKDKKQKFVIVDGLIMTARVLFHRDIHPNPIGGGWWFWDRERDTIYLYGTSFDFGSATKEQVEKAEFFSAYFKKSKIVFEPDPAKGLPTLLGEHMEASRAVELCDNNDFV